MSTTNESDVAGAPSDPLQGLTLLDRVRAVTEPVVVAHGLQLTHLEWLGTHHGRILRVSIDRLGQLDGELVSQGVTVNDCSQVSRDLSTALDVEEVVGERYSLEVSSPGLDRPLNTAQDFSRQVGKLAKVHLVSPSHDGQRVLRGQIIVVTEEHVTIDVDGNEHQFALDAVDKARLVFEFESGTKTKGGSDKKTWAPKNSTGGAKGHNRKSTRS